MLDKSKRKHQDTYRVNARSVNNNRTNSDDNMGEYLTDHAYHAICNELSLSQKCRVMRYDKDMFWVYTPDNESEQKKSLPPRYFLLRYLKIVKDKYLNCSCGYSSRNKIPCRHILSITKQYKEYMSGIRLLKIFQYTFRRYGFESLTSIFRQIEGDEYTRNESNSYIIYIGDTLNLNIQSTFPYLLPECTNDDENQILLLDKANEMKLCTVRRIDIDTQNEQHQPNEITVKVILTYPCQKTLNK